MSDRCLILSADAWNMTDEKTGEVMSGVSVWYVNDYRDDAEGSFGFKPTKVTLQDPDMFKQLSGKLPCLADLDFRSKPGAGGKASLVLGKIAVVKPSVQLFESAPAKAA